MNKEIYWLGPGVLSAGKDGKDVYPNKIIPVEVLEYLGEKRIKYFVDKKQMSGLTATLARQQAGKNTQEAVKKLQAEIADLKTTISTLTEASVDLAQKNKELSDAKAGNSDDVEKSPAYKKLGERLLNKDEAYQTKCGQNRELKIEVEDLTSANKTLKKHNDKLHKQVGKLEKKLTKKGIPITEDDRENEGDNVNLNDDPGLVNLETKAGPG